MSLRFRFWMAPVAGLILAAGAFIYIVDPSKAPYMPPCMLHELTGIHCPGCGTARGLHKLLHADIVGAWRMNPLMLLAIPLLIYLIARSSVPARPGAKQSPLPVSLPWLVVGTILSFWVLRNIPAYPFTLLAPH